MYNTWGRTFVGGLAWVSAQLIHSINVMNASVESKGDPYVKQVLAVVETGLAHIPSPARTSKRNPAKLSNTVSPPFPDAQIRRMCRELKDVHGWICHIKQTPFGPDTARITFTLYRP